MTQFVGYEYLGTASFVSLQSQAVGLCTFILNCEMQCERAGEVYLGFKNVVANYANTKANANSTTQSLCHDE